MPRVVVVGSSNTDMTVRVPKLPAPGQTVIGTTFSITPGGKGANQAVAARRAGAEVVFVTAVGNDGLGKQSLELYKREGIDVSHVRVLDAVASGVALIFVADNGENMIGVAPGTNHELTPDDLDRLPESLFRKDDVLLVSLEVPVETAVRALRRGFQSEMYTILNPAPAPPRSDPRIKELLAAAHMITPNRVEALGLAGLADDAADWTDCGVRLQATGPKIVVITLGPRGCQVIAAESWSIPALPVEAVDTVGAGDAFNGALAAAVADGRDLEKAVAWANAAAALAVTQFGAQSALPLHDAIDRVLAQSVAHHSECNRGADAQDSGKPQLS
jgi:ribokinase